ncbi:CRISPR-associated endonuclease Cas3'' [Infirmifilum sp.]|uniref:CRISPR-associated endonuclease Cas3'' n=1 Tax=Infirmifilum sp. TaxID=2856575 RepID=UPI003D131756
MTKGFTVRDSKTPKKTRVSEKTCSDPIACHKQGCRERLEEHVKLMTEIIKGPLATLVLYAEREYARATQKMLENDKELQDNLRSVFEKLLEDLEEKGILKMLVAFHDLGKCTRNFQDSLEKNCSAPYHEALSAYLLYHYFECLASVTTGFNNEDLSKHRVSLLKLVYPLILAVILHHHAMRDPNEVFDESPRELSKYVTENDTSCLQICSEKIFKAVDLSLPPNCIEGVKLDEQHLKEFFRSLKTLTGTLRILPSLYRAALLLVLPLSIADNLAAYVNRSLCVQEKTDPWSLVKKVMKDSRFSGFVRDFISSEELRRQLRGILRESIEKAMSSGGQSGRFSGNDRIR